MTPQLFVGYLRRRFAAAGFEFRGVDNLLGERVVTVI
jgi:hypothetical protein